jgi:hypothetical protein
MSAFQSESHSRRYLSGREQRPAYRFVRRTSALRCCAGTRDCIQFVLSVEGDIIGCINSEGVIASAVKASLVTIDKDCSFIVHSPKVE